MPKQSTMLKLLTAGAVALGSVAPETRETSHKTPDRTPFKIQLRELFEKEPLVLPDEGQMLEQKKLEEAPKSVPTEFKAIYSPEEFDSVPFAKVESLEQPPEDSASVKLFLRRDGGLVAETLSHLDNEGWIEKNRKKFPQMVDGKEVPNPALYLRGVGGFILESEQGSNQVLSVTPMISSASNIDNDARAFIPGINVAIVDGAHVHRCPNDPNDLKPLKASALTPDEVFNEELEINGIGLDVFRITGKAFPMEVTGTKEGKEVANHRIMMLKIDPKDVADPEALFGLQGSPVRLANDPNSCVGICTGITLHKAEDGSTTAILSCVGMKEVLAASRFVDENLLKEEEEDPGPAPDYAPGEGDGKTDF
ncbi:MAG: hypothetical protein ABL890_00425 [Candidatus Peribacteraceae bacterium]